MTTPTANTSPISPARPALSWNTVALTGANVTTDGTGTEGTTIATFLTAGADGARVNRVRVQHRGINVATVMRIYANNGSTNGTPSNNCLLAEKTIPALAALSQVAENAGVDIVLNVLLKPTYKLMYSIGTAVAAGHQLSIPDSGDY